MYEPKPKIVNSACNVGLRKGPSIKDVSSEGEGGYKDGILGRFSKPHWRVVKNFEKWADIFYGWSLKKNLALISMIMQSVSFFICIQRMKFLCIVSHLCNTELDLDAHFKPFFLNKLVAKVYFLYQILKSFRALPILKLLQDCHVFLLYNWCKSNSLNVILD